MKFATKAIHMGQEPDPTTGAIIPPIYMTSTYAQEAPGITKGYDYTRSNNPNFEMLETLLASLENGEHATVFSSGLGALTAMISTLSSGDTVLAIDGVYGGTYRLFTKVFSRFGITFHSIPSERIADLDQILVEQKPKWLFFETPTNPLLEIYDIEALTKLAKKHGVLTIVDNTFATPYFQQPLSFGVDVVWHSTTKYLGGHSDVIGGVVITNDAAFKKEMNFARMALGVNPSPFDVWLTTRGVKTLAVRMERHAHNAQIIAEYLEKHPLVSKVYYPGLPSHPGHALAKKNMTGFGGMLSADFHLPLETVAKMISSYRYFALAESLGGIESLVNHPATMTHASIPPDVRKTIGISDGLVRYSIGIENSEDLVADLEQGFARATSGKIA